MPNIPQEQMRGAEQERTEMRNPEGIPKRGILERIRNTRPLVKWTLGTLVTALAIGSVLIAKEVSKPEDVHVIEHEIIVPQLKDKDKDKPDSDEEFKSPGMQKGPKNSEDNEIEKDQHENRGSKQKLYKVPGSDEIFTLMA